MRGRGNSSEEKGKKKRKKTKKRKKRIKGIHTLLLLPFKKRKRPSFHHYSPGKSSPHVLGKKKKKGPFPFFLSSRLGPASRLGDKKKKVSSRRRSPKARISAAAIRARGEKEGKALSCFPSLVHGQFGGGKKGKGGRSAFTRRSKSPPRAKEKKEASSSLRSIIAWIQLGREIRKKNGLSYFFSSSR